MTFDPQVSAVISQCIADLDEMASLYHFAKIASNISQYIVGVEGGKASLDDLEEIFRLHAGDTHHLAAGVPAGYILNGSRLQQDKTREFASMQTIQATMLDVVNPPFWLFATQSRRMMYQTQDLEQSVFLML
jgi:hypothetical protein